MLLVIQGTVDTSRKLTQNEISKTVDFCFSAFQPAAREEREAVLRKVEGISINDSGSAQAKTKQGVDLEASLSADELRILNTIRARQMIRSEDTINIDNFNTDTIDGMVPNLKRGALGLATPPPAQAKRPEVDVLALLTGEKPKEEEPTEEPKAEQVPIAAY